MPKKQAKADKAAEKLGSGMAKKGANKIKKARKKKQEMLDAITDKKQGFSLE